MSVFKNEAGIARANAMMRSPERRAAVADARRSFNVGRGSGIQIPFEAAATNGMVPAVPDLGPLDSVMYTRRMQAIAQHLVRNSPWFQAIVRVMKSAYFSTGPTPRSRHSELVDLWMSSSAMFDGRGVHGFGSWLREDVAHNLFVDGEVFVRRQLDLENFDGVHVPLAFTAYQSACVPVEKTGANPDGTRNLAGVAYAKKGVRTLPSKYWFYQAHPRDLGQRGLSQNLVEIPADEVHHLYMPGVTGAARGHVILAAALIRALKLQQYEDAELRRKLSSTLLSLFIKRPLDGLADDSLFPSPKLVDELISMIRLVPGGVHELPAGYDADLKAPPDAPGFDKGVQIALQSICATVGIPLYEILGHVDGANERTMRFGYASMKTTGSIIRGDTDVRLLNRMWRSHVDAAFLLGLWSPGPGQRLEDAYDVTWPWPVIQSSALVHELGIMQKLAEGGHLPQGYIGETYFGLQHETVARQNAEQHARELELGFVAPAERWQPTTTTAARIAQTIAAEESRERDLVDAAVTGVSSIDDWPVDGPDF